ncbi:MAG: DUF2309 domain-containing protein, partial [Nitrospira sp.]|nr:DUF2309 domain-containing protein [Nitrospira sp.]
MLDHSEAPDSSPSETEADKARRSLRSKVAYAAELVHEQGPISTFIHTNPLHHLEHLTFDDAVAAAEQLLGGRGYLPNE